MTVVIPTDHDKGLVAVIATGGTIASQRDETGAAKPSLSGENLLSGLGGDSASVKPVELMAKDSSSLTISDMQAISDAVGVELADPAVCGVVVLHGTDAMEETSLLVHLQHRLGKPVIFTGAQFTADNPLSDGPANLQAAIAAAATPSNSEKGVLLSFGGKLLPVWGLYKRSADDPDAFDLSGPSDCPQSPEFSAPVDAIRVDIVAIYPGCEATHIDASLDAGAKGIVLCALGSGNANAASLMLCGVVARDMFRSSFPAAFPRGTWWRAMAEAVAVTIWVLSVPSIPEHCGLVRQEFCWHRL